MYPGESISLIIQSGQPLRIPQSCILDSQVSPMAATTLYHSNISSLKTTI